MQGITALLCVHILCYQTVKFNRVYLLQLAEQNEVFIKTI